MEEEKVFKFGEDFKRIILPNNEGIIDFTDFLNNYSKKEKHTKGFIYDSLMYRYIRAREQMAEYEYTKAKADSSWNTKEYYYKQARRDIMRFAQILDEAIGEHD